MLFIEVPFHIIQENPIIIEIWKKAFNNSQANFDLPELGGVGGRFSKLNSHTSFFVAAYEFKKRIEWNLWMKNHNLVSKMI